MAILSMTYWPVAPALATVIDAIYVLRSDAAAGEDLAGAILPQAQWLFGGRLAWRSGDEAPQWLPRAAAFGPSAVAVRFLTENTVVAGVGLFPEGWESLMPISAGSVVERVLDLAGLWGADALAPLALDAAEPDDALAAAVEAALLARLARSPPPDPRTTTISRWADGDGHDIAALAAKLGLSSRQVARLTVSTHGLPPRLLANKHKIMRAAAVLALGRHDNRRDTWTTEYADQSHYSRNFGRFIGVSPGRFLREPSPFVREVMRARAAIASSHPLGLDPATRPKPDR